MRWALNKLAGGAVWVSAEKDSGAVSSSAKK
jgi:hypothetical protein